jgi:hypothetical protein
VPTVLAGTFLFPRHQAARVLAGYAELAAGAPDELTAGLAVVSAPDGTLAVAVTPVWSGPGDGAAAVEDFALLGTPLHRQVTALSPLQLLRQNDGLFPDGGHYAIRTRNLATLTPDAVAAMIEAAETRPGPTAFLNIHHFHGAATRVPPQASAFGLRRDHLMVEIIAGGRCTTPAPGAQPHRPDGPASAATPARRALVGRPVAVGVDLDQPPALRVDHSSSPMLPVDARHSDTGRREPATRRRRAPRR